MSEQLHYHEKSKEDPVEAVQKVLQGIIDDAFKYRAILSEKKDVVETKHTNLDKENPESEKAKSIETNTSKSEIVVENPYMFSELLTMAVEKIYPQKSKEEKRNIVNRILAGEFLYYMEEFNKDTKFYYDVQFIEDRDNKEIGFRASSQMRGKENENKSQQLLLVPLNNPPDTH